MLEGKLSIQQKQAQKFAITPQLIQTLKIVHYPLPQLLQHISEELEENPFLEEITPSLSSNSNENPTIEYKEFSNKEDFLSYKKNTSYISPTDIIEQSVSEKKYLSDDLIEQLRIVYPKKSKYYSIGEYIISSLNNDGYLPTTQIPLIAQQTKAHESLVKIVLEEIKKFSPLGIACANLQESLLVQLIQFKPDHVILEKQIIKEYFDLLQKKKYETIAKKTNHSLQRVKKALKNISMLEPKPSRPYQTEQIQYILPDAHILEKESGFEVKINNDFFPKMTYNQEYKPYLHQQKNQELKNYLQEKSTKANQLLESIEYRQSHLKKILTHLIKKQDVFLKKGFGHLKAYTLRELSEKTGINQGTLSRIVNKKYVQTKWGLLNLRVFFTSGIKHKEQIISADKIKNMIKVILEEYSTTKKLSDQNITEILKKKGYTVARRTVSKYRNSLQIFSSFDR